VRKLSLRKHVSRTVPGLHRITRLRRLIGVDQMLSGAKRKTEPFGFRPRSRTTATSILPSLNGKTARPWRDIFPLRTSHGRGCMTVTLGRRELLAVLGGAAAAWLLAVRAQMR
jgi:hypothetical protein